MRMRRRIGLACTVILGVGAIAFSTFVRVHPRLVYNPSTSAPRGWYWIVLDEVPAVGTYALAALPRPAAKVADERGYLPASVPILKRIGASSGQQVCEQDGAVRIDGRIVARALKHDGAGRPLAAWNECRRLAGDELFFLNTESAASYDSRYFGPVHRALVIGKAVPLWTW